MAERTKQLIDFIFPREYRIEKQHYDDDTNECHENVWNEDLATSYENVLKHIAVSKKRSIAILSKLLGLPDLVIDKIFINIVESYNWHFDQYGPEEMPWLYEELEEDDPESQCEEDDKYPEFYYNMISDVYERIRSCTIPVFSDDKQVFAFDWLGFTLEGIDGIDISDSVSGDG